MKMVLISALAGGIFCVGDCSGVDMGIDVETEAVGVVLVDADKVLEEDFLGAGVQWSAYPWFDVSEADWQKVFRRVDHMRPGFVRVMVDLTTFFDGLDPNDKPKYLFDCELMKRVYKLLDYCEDRGVTVLFGHWGWANTAKHCGEGNWNIDPTSAVHGEISGALADQLVNVKGYKCIRWFDPINEPDGSWSSCNGNWEQWKGVVRSIYADFKKRGLAEKVGITGTCDVYGKWVEKAVSEDGIGGRLAVYNEHFYLWNAEVVSGAFEQRVRGRVEKINATDVGKQYFAGELGFLDGKNERDQQVSVYEFWYGVSMVDAAVQMMRAGASGMLAWDLDDSMHWAGDSDGPLDAPADAYDRRKIWGFWNITGSENGMADDENMRPWFYAWSALCRSFPKGCKIIETGNSNSENVRVIAAKKLTGDKYNLSFAIVNNCDKTNTIKIVLPQADEAVTLGVYEYFDSDGDNKVDAWAKTVDDKGDDIFPEPGRKMKNVNLKKGMVMTLPGRGVAVLTTLEGGKAVRLKQ